MSDLCNLGCLESGIFRICLGYGMFEMWDVWQECLRYSGCGMSWMWHVWDIGYSGGGMFGMWDVWGVGCLGGESFGCDVFALGCEMFRMWNVADV